MILLQRKSVLKSKGQWHGNDKGRGRTMSRILVGIPGFAGVQPESQEGYMRMLFRLGRDTYHEVMLSIVTKSEQFRARNQLVNAALKSDADYLLMLDDDMLVPPDILQRLLAHDKDVTGALYYQRGGSYHPVIMKRHEREGGDFSCSFLPSTDPVIMQPGLHQVDIIGGGCMLFKMHVFDKMLEPYFWWEANAGTDISICNRLREAGFEIYVDTTLELGHIGERQIINSRTVPLEGRVLAEANDSLFEDLKEYLQMTDEQLILEMDKAIDIRARANVWNEKTRESWEDIREYYQHEGSYHLTNLAYFNLHSQCPIKAWALLPRNELIKQQGEYLSYGAGLGHLEIPLARKVGTITGMDIKDSPTQSFFRWRAGKSSGTVNWYPLREEVPDLYACTQALDGTFMTSVIEHLDKPYEVLKWIGAHTQRGGFLAVDWLHGTGDENNPQHLDHYDVATFPTWMETHGWEMSHEFDWLWLKKE